MLSGSYTKVSWEQVDNNELLRITVIHRTHGLEASARAHEYNATTFWLLLHVMNSKSRCVHHTLQIHVQCVICWFLQFPSFICLEGKVVGARANAGVGENIVNSSKMFLRFLEQITQIRPDGHIALYEQPCRRRVGNC